MTTIATELAPAVEVPAHGKTLAPFRIQPITFSETAEALRGIAAESMQLTVSGLDDKAGIEACHKQRMIIAKLRGNIEKRRKGLKSDALEYGRQVDNAAKELAAIIAPAEKHLADQESIVKREQERLAREAEEKRQAMIRERLRLLQECGKAYMAEEVAALSQDDFDSLLGVELNEKRERDERLAHEEAERQRIAAEQKAEADRLANEREELERQRLAAEARVKRMQARITMLANCEFKHELDNDQLADMPNTDWEQLLEAARRQKAERERAAAEERAKLERQKKEQAEAQAKIDGEKRAIFQSRVNELRRYACPGTVGKPGVVAINLDSTDEDFQAALAQAKEWKAECDAQQKAEQERREKEAAERAVREAEEQRQRDEAEAKARAEAEAAEAKRIEAARPDAEKLLALAKIVAALDVPTLSASHGMVESRVKGILQDAASEIIKEAKLLTTKKQRSKQPSG